MKELIMFGRTIRVAAVMVLGLLLAVASVAGDERVVTREFPASPGETLTLDLDAGGSVDIEVWDKPSISVTYEASGDGGDRIVIKFIDKPDGLKIKSSFESPLGRRDAYLEFDIKLPEEFDIEFASNGGGLKLDGLTGSFSGKTNGGSLTLHDVRGRAELTTMGGEIRLSDSELDGYLKTYGGDVRFEDVVGDVKGSSMGGNVKYKNVVRTNGEVGFPTKMGGVVVDSESVQISTMGGEIEIDEAPEGASLKTMGGDIRVTDAGRFVHATTMGGDILLKAVDGRVNATTMGGDVDVTVVGSGGDVEITSMSGDIMLVLPAGFSAEFDIELAYTKGSKQDYEIRSDVALKQSGSSEWDRSKGSPRKYIRAVGTVGGGEHKVKIRTVNGDIDIK
jgi:DUF4097 and DUF4098 domain-containing protein YvlB